MYTNGMEPRISERETKMNTQTTYETDTHIGYVKMHGKFSHNNNATITHQHNHTRK